MHSLYHKKMKIATIAEKKCRTQELKREKGGAATALKKTLPHLLGSVVIIYYALKTVIGSISSPL